MTQVNSLIGISQICNYFFLNMSSASNTQELWFWGEEMVGDFIDFFVIFMQFMWGKDLFKQKFFLFCKKHEV